VRAVSDPAIAIGSNMNAVCPACANTSFRLFARMANHAYLRCRTCGLLALDPFPTLEAIERHYALRFETGNYQTLLAFSEQYRKIYDDYVKWIARHTTLPGKRSLDVGCFTGGLVAAFVKGGADAYGVELQSDAVAVAERDLPGRIFGLNIDDASGPFAEGSLDIVTMMAVIEHVREPGRLLKRIRTLMKDEGWLFLETPNASSWPATITRRYWPLLSPIEHIYLFSESAMRQVLHQAGFELVEVRPHIKWLSPAYVHDMLRFYGPEWRSVAGAVFRMLPSAVRTGSLFPFFAGEMLVAARARS
jgi:SAM-dependent methyltransferase